MKYLVKVPMVVTGGMVRYFYLYVLAPLRVLLERGIMEYVGYDPGCFPFGNCKRAV
jgi:hypothetical protein